jgi:hypothetical protein
MQSAHRVNAANGLAPNVGGIRFADVSQRLGIARPPGRASTHLVARSGHEIGSARNRDSGDLGITDLDRPPRGLPAARRASSPPPRRDLVALRSRDCAIVERVLGRRGSAAVPWLPRVTPGRDGEPPRVMGPDGSHLALHPDIGAERRRKLRCAAVRSPDDYARLGAVGAFAAAALATMRVVVA